MVKKSLFSVQASDRVVEGIKKLESKTSIEVVVAIIRSSSARKESFLLQMWRIFAIVFVGVFLFFVRDFIPHLWVNIFCVVALVISLANMIPVRLFPFLRKGMEEDVWKSAMAYFMKSGIHLTRERTGILVYVAEEEHLVILLADQGINAVVPENYWKDKSKQLAEAMRNKALDAQVLLLLEELYEKYGSFFPRRSDDINELEDNIHQ